mmetsp:Transcript_41827/g.124112  ORF Transcript_41827/g.124112 Transcript_41827/m.124112 type:complete len:206 (-) Transcript_41827:227-844(-)
MEEQQQVPVHLPLHVAAIQVVGVPAEWILNLHGDEVQGPQDEDLDEDEDKVPGRGRHPLRCHQGRDEPVQEEEGVAGLGVGERERDVRDLHGVVKRNHAVGDLLERPGQDRRRDGEHARVDVLHDEALDPGEDELHLRRRALDDSQALLVQAAGVDDAQVEGLDVVGHLAIDVDLLQLRQGRGVQHAEEAHQRVLEGHDRAILVP